MKKLLIVDDSAFMRNILKDLLTENLSEVEIFEAENKNTAMLQVKEQKPELVLLDIVMQDNELEGVQILDEIKKTHPKTNVIMLTSVGQISIVEQCKKLGVQYYIEKPFDKDKVLECVKKYLY